MDFKFSPNYRLDDITEGNVLNAIKDRIKKYYCEPIEMLNDKRFGFAAIGLLASLIDILAKTKDHITEHNSRTEYLCWLQEKLGLDKQIALDFYYDFRCGLLHSGCIESGGQVSYEINKQFCYYEGHLFVNPIILLKKIEDHFNEFIESEDPNELFEYFEKKLQEIE